MFCAGQYLKDQGVKASAERRMECQRIWDKQVLQSASLQYKGRFTRRRVAQHAASIQQGVGSSTSAKPLDVKLCQIALPNPVLAYDIYQGAQVDWACPGSKAPPTAVLLHGLLGNRRNMQTFAKMLVQRYPQWQVVLVDLPCHGESAFLPSGTGATTVIESGRDVMTLLAQLKLFPNVLIGHSYGGKVVMSMAQPFGQILPRPVKIWVLDTLPGNIRPGEFKDHPGDLINTLLNINLPIISRQELVDHLLKAGFSDTISKWVTTNLKRSKCGTGFSWTFDLQGIQNMYNAYQATSLWPVVHEPPKFLELNFVKADASTFRWGGDDEKTITSAGHEVHLLDDSGHWVHTDNPHGLIEILGKTFKNFLTV